MMRVVTHYICSSFSLSQGIRSAKGTLGKTTIMVALRRENWFGFSPRSRWDNRILTSTRYLSDGGNFQQKHNGDISVTDWIGYLEMKGSQTLISSRIQLLIACFVLYIFASQSHWFFLSFKTSNLSFKLIYFWFYGLGTAETTRKNTKSKPGYFVIVSSDAVAGVNGMIL